MNPNPTCGEALVRLLEAYDVDTVFGVPGVHTLELYRGLAASGVRHVLPRAGSATSCRATSRAAASWPTAMRACPAGPGSAS